jgi:alpha-amylase
MQYLLWILTKFSDNCSRIYVDIVINHMTADSTDAVGVGGTTADTYNKDYPGVPYVKDEFNPSCNITDYQNPYMVSDTEFLRTKLI